nr:MAG TPA: hypothetical protein [Caudoviricetes sp.]
MRLTSISSLSGSYLTSSPSFIASTLIFLYCPERIASWMYPLSLCPMLYHRIGVDYIFTF